MNRVIRGAASLMVAASAFAAGHITVSREVIVERPAAALRSLVGSFDALDRWLAPVHVSSYTPDQISLTFRE
jgi:hypothetical protein